ncbi:nitroreductase family protein [Penicillium odoratum]|uniref:nitroreductase family protein n=1 Tax=Penicillium odoratum TaxID=1167516 RepID=UPI002548933D|nr:nitroreductase family protein [Penicillium odoratum]KAJ5778713.1 nitroreductase family protein [Penicillium odoratum]
MSTGSSAFLAALANRRSYYALRSASPILDGQIRSILSEVMLKTPSAFNSQTTRAVLLLKKEHEKFWEIVKDVLLARIGPERFAKTGPKLDSFKAAYGTVLFYEDQPVVAQMKEKFPSYAENFDPWSEHTSGMHQLNAWVALEAEGFGANLQHYNPIIDERVQAAFQISKDWKLRSQLVFGTPDGDTPAPKDKLPVNQLLTVLGADS